ncbi:cell division protein ZapA [Candidatus Erwinia haradaeae]|uniref:Cell division protein ZapA n=1 Tax=Candidatus Erwinia haradaeae TaxID=1922217 RepID=A0A451DPE4_9GAMM|nr:cell division protein ZapA [Candidatus Erwinia haradaeae]VFP88665.1 Cell division protein ZapA [Candidatus Erwinia haradaeae]
MPEKPVDLYIFGNALRVHCPLEQREALSVAVEDLTKQLTDLKNRTKITNTNQLIFSTALNLCYALSQEKLKNNNNEEHLAQRIKILYTVLEKTLHNTKKVLSN